MTVPEVQRQQILDQTLIQMTGNGGRVVTQTPTSAVVALGKPVNHILHMLLSLFLCTLWIPAWMLITAVGGERRTTVQVDPYGQVQRAKAPIEPHRVILLVIAGVWALMILLFMGSCASAFSK